MFDETGGKWKLTGETTGKEYQTLDDSDDSQFAMTFEVPNQKKMPLPATGGKGTRKLTALSSSLLLLGGAYFAARARHRKED
jgi:LPXTG-motif cell wall-anchored protein